MRSRVLARKRTGSAVLVSILALAVAQLHGTPRVSAADPDWVRNTVEVHGPYDVSAADLTTRGAQPEDATGEAGEGLGSSDDSVRCTTCETPTLSRTPDLRNFLAVESTSFFPEPAVPQSQFEVDQKASPDGKNGKRIDPQMAASRKAIVIGGYNNVYFYAKSGKLLPAKDPDATLTNPIKAGALFSKAVPDMEASMNLPPGYSATPCPGSADDPGGPSTLTCGYGLYKFYDARVIYDEFRGRFWIFVQVKNNKADREIEGTNVPDPDVNRYIRRDYMITAVSKSEDPRDGFYVYWWKAMPHQGACNYEFNGGRLAACPGTDYTPGDSVDYPRIGMSSKYLIETQRESSATLTAENRKELSKIHGVPVSQTKAYLAKGRATIVPAGPLALGQAPSNGYAFDRIRTGVPANADGTRDLFKFFVSHRDSMEPVMNHGAGPALFVRARYNHKTFDASNEDQLEPTNGNTISYWSVRDTFAGPVLDRRDVTVSTYRVPPIVPQGNSTSENWMRFGHTWTLDAVQRGAYVYAAMMTPTVTNDGTCAYTDPANGGSCVAAIRLIKFRRSDGAPSIDRTFGMRSALDPVPTVYHYGAAQLDVRPNGDIVVDMGRSAFGVPLEARFAVWRSGAGDIGMSKPYKTGVGTLGPDPYFYDVLNAINLDPFNGSVWLANYFASDPDGNGVAVPLMAIAKVFGNVVPDVEPGLVTTGYRGTISSTVTIMNLGDGTSPTSTVRFYLSSDETVDESDYVLGSVTLPAILKGAQKSVSGTFDAPYGVYGTFHVIAVPAPDKSMVEYDQANAPSTSPVVNIEAK